MSDDISNKELIKLAVGVLNPIERDGDWIGDVGAALITDKGNIYTGVCVDVGSGAGFCAERAAIARMFSNKEQTLRRFVAVWNNNPEKDVYVLPPCGACRLFMFSRLESGLDIEVVISSDKTVTLRELYPYHEWPKHKETL